MFLHLRVLCCAMLLGAVTSQDTYTVTPTVTSTPSTSATEQTKTQTPSITTTHTPSRSDTSTVTPSPTSSDTDSPSLTETTSGTPTNTPSPTSTSSPSPTSSLSPSRSSSITPSRSNSPTPSTSSLVAPAITSASVGAISGVLAAQFGAYLFFFAGACLRWRRRGGVGGKAALESDPLLPNATAVGVSPSGDPAAGVLDAPPPPVPTAAELAALRASVESAREQLASLERASADAKAGISREQSQDVATVAVEESPLWDRADFLLQTAAAVVALTQILDEHIADSFAGTRVSSRVAVAIRELHARVERAVLADAARVTAAVRGVIDPLRSHANPAVLRAAAAFIAASFGARIGGVEAERLKAAHAVVDAWLQSLLASALCSEGGVAELSTATARGALAKYVCLHTQLTLWPLAVDANIAWSVGGTEDTEGVRAAAAASETDSALVALGEDHQLFSLDGSTVAAGAPVYEVGAALCARVPLWGGGEAATPQQLAELRAGARCRTVCLKG